MRQNFEDLLRRGAEPTWWETSGHPRYTPFAPEKIWNFCSRTKEVALVKISCQQCAKEFDVCFSWSGDCASLSERIKHENYLDYGDPPDVGCCAAGPSMLSGSEYVIEFWRETKKYKWKRKPKLEVYLLDWFEPEKRGGRVKSRKPTSQK